MKKKNNIQAYRIRKLLTQEDLAERLGVSRSTVAAWETGRIYPQASRLMDLAKALGVTVEQLFGA